MRHSILSFMSFFQSFSSSYSTGAYWMKINLATGQSNWFFIIIFLANFVFLCKYTTSNEFNWLKRQNVYCFLCRFFRSFKQFRRSWPLRFYKNICNYLCMRHFWYFVCASRAIRIIFLFFGVLIVDSSETIYSVLMHPDVFK